MNLFEGSLLPRHLCFIAIAIIIGKYSLTSHADNTPPASSCHFDKKLDLWVCDDATELRGASFELDWVPLEYFNAEQQDAIAPGCAGMYLDPLAAELADPKDISSLPLVIEADTTQVEDGIRATLKGDVRLSQGTRSIAAELMSYDREFDNARLAGDVTIRQPGMLIRGDDAQISTIEQSGKFSNARFVMHDTHMRGSAGSIEQDGPNRIVLRDGAITSCEPGSNAWSLEGKELSINRSEGQGRGKHVKLKIGGVPVFYIPYISFPVGDERQSGFLFPSISTSGEGIDISLPYYLNLAPNYDITLTPRVISGRGSMLEAEFRHLNELFYTELSGAFLPNDGGGNDEDVDRLIEDGVAKESELRPHKGNNRWLVQFRQTGGRRTGWYSSTDYTKISDEDYFRDLGTSSFAVTNRTFLNQSVDVGTSLNNWEFAARAQDYQTLLLDLDSPYRKLPQLTANGLYRTLGGLRFLLNHQLTHFDHKDEFRLDGSPILTGQRLNIDHRLQWEYRNQSGYIKPELGYKYLRYNLDAGDSDSLNEDAIDLGANQASLDIGLVLDHPNGNYLQTLEPRIFYLFRGFEDHSDLYNATVGGQSVNFDTSARTFSYDQLYRDSRFSGSDRLDDANQVTVGVTNRWYSLQDGHEFFNLSVGRINHFRDRRVGLEREISDTENASEIALDFAAFWRNGSGLYGGLIYDDAAEEMNRFSAGYNYASQDQLSLFSVSYNFVRQNPEVSASEQLDQLDSAFVVPASKQWSVMGRANYDFQNSQELESFLGLEYNDCCYRFRILARRWLDSNIANLTSDEDAIFDQGVFFEIHLKGLGGSGARVNSILEDAIPGYRRRETALNKY